MALEVTICFDKNSPSEPYSNFSMAPYFPSEPNKFSKEKILFPKKITKKNRSTLCPSLPYKILKEYSCFHFGVEKIPAIGKSVGVLTKKLHFLSYFEDQSLNLENSFNLFESQYLSEIFKKELLSTHFHFSSALNTYWSYKYLTHLHLKKLSGQVYGISLKKFSHPNQPLDIEIKAHLHKWSIIDNKFGSALIRLD